VFLLFVHYGLPLWVPEVGGAIDPNNEAHDLITSVLGGMSKGERNRIKLRIRTAIAAQARLEGRFLGGHPAIRLHAGRSWPTPPTRRGGPGRGLTGKRSVPGESLGDREYACAVEELGEDPNHD
jgi:hypothetical protein